MRYFRVIVYALTILLIVVFVYFRYEDFISLGKINAVDLFIIYLAAIVPIFFNSLLFHNNIRIFGLQLKFKEWFGLTVGNTMYNYLLPANGGTALRAIYLKNKQNFPYSEYLSFTASVYLLNLFIGSLIACSVGFYLYSQAIIVDKSLVVIASLLCLGFGILFIFLLKIDFPDSTRSKILRFAMRVANGFKNFRGKHRAILNLIFLQIAFLLTSSFRLYLSFGVFDIKIDFLMVLLIGSLVSISKLFSIAPGNLGVKEGIIGYLSLYAEIPLEDAIFVSIIDRIVATSLIFFLGIFFTRFLLDIDLDELKNVKKK